MAPPFPPDDERLRAVRAALPAVGAGIYLDTATAGPLPAETSAAMAELAEWEGRTGRASDAFLEEAAGRLEECRAAVAAVLTADVDQIAITTSAEASVASAVAAVGLRPGDAVVTTAPGHAPALRPVLRVASALGLTLAEFPLGDEARPLLGAFDAALATRPRLVALPHVSAATGEVLPIRSLADVAHAAGALVLVDGSAAAGAIPVDVPAIGADRYAVAGDAWLLGPSGTGALWVAPGGLAASFDSGGWYRPAVAGLARGIGWLSMYVGLEWLFDRAAALSAVMAARLREIPGVSVVTPSDPHATIVSFAIDGWPAADALEELSARVFLIARAIDEPEAVRLSVAGFNSASELERLLDAVALLAAHGPGSLPPRRSLTILHDEPR